MKKKLFILPIVASIVFVFLLFMTGCEKLRYCSNYEYGRYYKLANPYPHPYADYEIQAVFLSGGEVKGITGRIPAQFRVSDTIPVRVSLKEVYPKGKITNESSDNVPVYKIICIEEDPS